MAPSPTTNEMRPQYWPTAVVVYCVATLVFGLSRYWTPSYPQVIPLGCQVLAFLLIGATGGIANRRMPGLVRGLCVSVGAFVLGLLAFWPMLCYPTDTPRDWPGIPYLGFGYAGLLLVSTLGAVVTIAWNRAKAYGTAGALVGTGILVALGLYMENLRGADDLYIPHRWEFAVMMLMPFIVGTCTWLPVDWATRPTVGTASKTADDGALRANAQ